MTQRRLPGRTPAGADKNCKIMMTFNTTAEQKPMKNRLLNALGLTFIYAAAATFVFLQLRSIL